MAILFLDDWKRYPTARPDLKTTNDSFLRLAQVYRQMGVKNHLFPLALIQPELQGVDPFDPNLSKELKMRIGLECKSNPWYFFRECVRLPARAGSTPIRFRANRGNIALPWLFYNHITAALIQPRQTGKSRSTDCLNVGNIYVHSLNTRINLLTKDEKLRNENVEALKEIRDLLPSYLVNITSEDTDNRMEITCKALGNRYMTHVAQNSLNAANNMGRGLTSPIFHIDESPFISFIDEALPAALSAGNAARDEAERNGMPYGTILTTTAGKKDTREGMFIYAMIHGGATWTEAFFDAVNREQLADLVKKAGTNRAPLVNITLNHRQLGYTDEWLYEKMASTNSTGDAANRDYLNWWTSGSLRSPLTTQLSEIIRGSQQEPKYIQISRSNYILRWYLTEEEIKWKMKAGRFAMGIDTSDAVGRDATSLVITDLSDMSVVAVGTYNETNLMMLAQFFCEIMVEHPTITMIIEKKLNAQALIDFMLLFFQRAGVDPFRRLYNRVVDASREDPEAYMEICGDVSRQSEQFFTARKSKFGFVTDADNRKLLYGTVLQNMAKEAGHATRDSTLIQELLSLVVKDGRIDHKASGHDDHVIALLLTHWFANYAQNLEHYGINTREVRAGVAMNVGKAPSPLELLEAARQKELMQEIGSLVEQLKATTSEIEIMRLEFKLKHLTAQVKDAGGDSALSLDALLKDIEDSRMRSRETQRRRMSLGHPAPFQQQGLGSRIFRC